MQERGISQNQSISKKEETEAKSSGAVEEVSVDEKERLTAELQEINDKYLRLYAEFENYKKRVNKDKDELLKYGNESLLYELLPVIDNLEMALKHSSNEISAGLIQGVEITLRELLRTLEKFGLTPIEATGKPFDPLIHHAMTLVEREDIEEKIVVEEFRKGYMFKDKVLRPSLVAVSKRPQKTVNSHQSLVESQEKETNMSHSDTKDNKNNPPSPPFSKGG
ncbi:MAG: nucleotide exchange factor GrpE, partial [Nitrospirota bacterium]